MKLHEPMAAYYRENPPELTRFISILQQRTGLAPSLPSYPTDSASIDGAKLRDLKENEGENYAKAAEAIRIPREPLFFYCAGAHWGEWLVRHRQATWQLYAPLRPMQAFPDMVSASNTMCYHPFAQATGKMTDPEGDALEFASAPCVVDRYLPPYPLIAAPSDAEHASKMTLPVGVRDAASTNDYARFLNGSKNAPVRVYALALEQAWKDEEWKLVDRWSREAIRLAPRNPLLRHNLAALLSSDPKSLSEAISLLRQALAQNENYARAHLTLAACLLDAGQRDEARVHAEWVRDHDEQLKREAEQLLARVGQ